MITGRVTDDHEAVIHLIVHGSDGREREIEAVIDTGFDGWLSLPSGFIAALGLAWRSRGRALLADGSETLVDIYEATVVWDSQARRIAVDAADTAPLVGMSLLHGYELTIQVVDGGSVAITALP